VIVVEIVVETLIVVRVMLAIVVVQYLLSFFL